MYLTVVKEEEREEKEEEEEATALKRPASFSTPALHRPKSLSVQGSPSDTAFSQIEENSVSGLYRQLAMEARLATLDAIHSAFQTTIHSTIQTTQSPNHTSFGHPLDEELQQPIGRPKQPTWLGLLKRH